MRSGVCVFRTVGGASTFYRGGVKANVQPLITWERNMGTWGAGLFCDDVACDIRTQFRELLREGQTIPQATRRILEEWQEAVEDADDGPVIWLALASLQWDRGGLQSSVKQKAIRIIDSGIDLDRWRSSGDAGKVGQRKAVLRKLRQKLESTQPERKQPAPRPAAKSSSQKKKAVGFEWRVGDVIAYRLRSGDWVLLHTVQCSDARKKQDVVPTFAVLDWQGSDIPDADRILKLPYRKPPETTLAWGDEVASIDERRAYCIQVAHRSLTNIPVKRLQQLEVSRKLPFRKPRGWNPGVLWRLLDRKLEEDLGLK